MSRKFLLIGNDIKEFQIRKRIFFHFDRFNKKLMKLFKVKSPEEEIEEGNQAVDRQREGTPGEDEAAICKTCFLLAKSFCTGSS